MFSTTGESSPWEEKLNRLKAVTVEDIKRYCETYIAGKGRVRGNPGTTNSQQLILKQRQGFTIKPPVSGNKLTWITVFFHMNYQMVFE